MCCIVRDVYVLVLEEPFSVSDGSTDQPRHAFEDPEGWKLGAVGVRHGNVP